MKQCLKRTWYWILLLLSTDMVFIFATWIIRREAIPYMSLFFFLFTVLVLSAGFLAELHRQRREETLLLQFLDMPEEKTKAGLIEYFDGSETIRVLCTRILSDLTRLNEKTVELSEYREYIEAWVHEAKTPLSHAMLVINNHRDEMSPYVYKHLNHGQHQLNENMERILFYARLQAEHPDIRFIRFRLDECVMEVLAEYQGFIEEKKIEITTELEPLAVVSDSRIVAFMMSQLISNAVKYADSREGKIMITIRQDKDTIHLAICNNGDGVPPEDMPFIFDKGFTGSCPSRQKATGMGLYLVRKYAQKLCVQVQIVSRIPCDTGFGIEILFSL